MEKIKLQNISLILGGILISLFLSSCLTNTGNEFTTQAQIGFEVKSLDSTITAGSDSIHIDNVRFILGESFFTKDSDSLRFISNKAMISFDPEGLQFRNPLPLGGGALPAGTYQNVQFQIPQAPDDNSQIDDDFTSGNRHFSLIVKGTYHEDSFTYKSSTKFTPERGFLPPIKVAEKNEQYVFILQTDAGEWFSKGGGGFYDPSDDQNTSDIDLNISHSFEITKQSQKQ